MWYRLAADAVALAHFLFVVFVVAGGLLVWRWGRAAWVHLPAAIWGALIEFGGWVCPLTPLENWLRDRAGSGGYRGGFIDHYLLPVLYPSGLSRSLQVVLGIGVVVVNLAIYGWLLRRRSRAASSAASRRR